jgi:hypothetical protein
MVAASRMAAMTFTLLPQWEQLSKSTLKTRLSSWAQRIRRREGFGFESCNCGWGTLGSTLDRILEWGAKQP